MTSSALEKEIISAQDDLGKRYWRASFDSLLRGGASLVISGLVPILLARYLGPHDFGIYSIITALTALVAALLHLGQNSPLHKLLPEYAVSDPARAGAILANMVALTTVLVSLFSLSFLLSAPFVAKTIYLDSSLTGYFRFCAVMIFFMTLSNLAASIAAGMQEFRLYNTTQLLRSGLLLILAIISVSLWGLWGALVSQILASAVTMLWLALQLRSILQSRFSSLLRLNGSCEIWQPIAVFMLPALVMILLNAPSFWWANTMTARTQGFTQAGLFSAAYGIFQLIALAPYNFYVPALTFLSEAQSKMKSAEFHNLVLRSLRGIWLLMLPLALGCALFSSWLLHLFFGSQFQAAMPAAFLLCLAALFMCVVGLLNAVIGAAGQLWQGCIITFLWALLFVVAGFLFIPRWGAFGAATTFAISYVGYFLLQCFYFHLVLKVDLRRMWRPWVLTGVSYSSALILAYSFSGTALSVSSAFLLLLTIVGVFLIRDETERRVCEQGVARVKQLVWSW